MWRYPRCALSNRTHHRTSAHTRGHTARISAPTSTAQGRCFIHTSRSCTVKYGFGSQAWRREQIVAPPSNPRGLGGGTVSPSGALAPLQTKSFRFACVQPLRAAAIPARRQSSCVGPGCFRGRAPQKPWPPRARAGRHPSSGSCDSRAPLPVLQWGLGLGCGRR